MCTDHCVRRRSRAVSAAWARARAQERCGRAHSADSSRRLAGRVRSHHHRRNRRGAALLAHVSVPPRGALLGFSALCGVELSLISAYYASILAFRLLKFGLFSERACIALTPNCRRLCAAAASAPATRRRGTHAARGRAETRK